MFAGRGQVAQHRPRRAAAASGQATALGAWNRYRKKYSKNT